MQYATPHGRGQRSTTAGRHAQAGEKDPRTTGPGLVAERRMQALAVVEPDATQLAVLQRFVGGQCPAVQRLGLHRMEERRHAGLVIQLAGPVHALHDTVAAELLSMLPGGAVEAPIPVKDEAGPWFAQAQGRGGEIGDWRRAVG